MNDAGACGSGGSDTKVIGSSPRSQTIFSVIGCLSRRPARSFAPTCALSFSWIGSHRPTLVGSWRARHHLHAVCGQRWMKHTSQVAPRQENNLLSKPTIVEPAELKKKKKKKTLLFTLMSVVSWSCCHSSQLQFKSQNSPNQKEKHRHDCLGSSPWPADKLA